MRTLLVDCSTPYLIGIDSSLLGSLWQGDPAQPLASSSPPAALQDTAVVVNLDAGTLCHPPTTGWFRAPISPLSPPYISPISPLHLAGTVFHPPTTAWFRATHAPVLSLVRELSGCMGDVTQFKQVAVQAACLR